MCNKTKTICISDMADYSFSKQLNSRKNKIIDFLIDNYSDVFDDYEKINALDRKEVAQKYINQTGKAKTNDDELVNEVAMFVDLFLVKNHLVNYYEDRMRRFNAGESNEKPHRPPFKTNVYQRVKENSEKGERDNKKRSLGMMLDEEKDLLKYNMEQVAKQSGYTDCSSALIDEFVDFYKDKDSKLKVATLWTSAGKSYATKMVTGKAFDFYGKELIVTPNKCNLPQDQELVDAIKAENHDITEDEIIMLDSVIDNIANKTEHLEEFKNDISNSKQDNQYYKELKKSIDVLIVAIKSLNENGNSDKDFQDFLRDRVYDADVEFRSKIKALIRNDSDISKQIKGKTRKEQIKNLCNITEFKRLPDIFPQLKLYNAKVIIMSAMRMLYPIDMILFSHTNIIESDIIDKNTNVVLDEIDDIYVKFLDKILKDMQDEDGRINVFLFLEKVYDFITKKGRLVLNDVDEDTLIEWNETYYKELKEYIDQLFNHPLNLRGYTFKTEEDRDVLIYVTENQEFVSIDTNVSKNITHKFDDISKQICIKTTEEQDNSTNELIAQINTLFNNVKDTLFKLTKEYYDYFNKNDVNVKWTYEQALSSILTHISAGDEEYGKSNAKRLFTEFVSKTNFSDEKDTDTAQIMKAINESGLANNYSIYTFSNHESHKENAILYCCFNKISPEVLLFKLLIKTKKVLGLSATGFLKSKKSNFDFDKINECEKIYYEKNKNKLDLIEKEKPFTVSENILKYKEAIEYQTNVVKPHSYTEILKYDAHDTALNKTVEQIENDFDAIIAKNIAKINIDEKNSFIIILKNKVSTVDKNTRFTLLRQLNQIHCILQSIINENRTLLMIKNKKLDTDVGFEDLIKNLKDKVFIGKTIAYKSLTDLGKKVNKDDSVDDEDQKKIDIELKEFYTKNSDDNTILYILFSSIATVATGVNLYQIIKKDRIDISIDGSDSKKDFYWKIPDYYNRFQKESPFKSNTKEYDIYIKADIDAGYHENKTHLKYQFQDEKYAERLNALYELNTFVCGNNAVDVEDYNNAVQQAMNCSTSLNQEKVIKESILAAEFKYLSQSLGRKERNVIGCKNKSTFVENSTVQLESGTGFLPLLERIDSPKYSYSDNAGTIAITQQMKEIKQKLREELRLSEMDNISIIPDKDALDRMISSLWDTEGRRAKKYKQIYNDLKDNHLLTKNITMSREKYEQEKKKYNEKYDDEPIIEFDSLYIKKPSGIKGYTYLIPGTKLQCARWITSKWPLKNYFTKEDLQLDVMNSILHQYGEEMIHMDENDDYIISPVFADFVKGDIAEMVFESLVKKMLTDNHISSHLDKYFEFFDYTTNSQHRYIDIKYWKTEKVENYIKKKEINDKLNKVTGTQEGKVLLINMCPVEKVNKEIQTYTCEGAKIQIINNIIDKNGSIDKDILGKLYDFITKE